MYKIMILTLMVTILMLNGCRMNINKEVISHNKENEITNGSKVDFSVMKVPSNSWILPNDDSVSNPKFLIIDNKEDLVRKLNFKSADPISGPFPPKELDLIDFQKDIVIYMTRGRMSSGAYRFNIQNVKIIKDKVKVYLHYENPKGPLTDDVIYQVYFLKIPKSSLPKGNIKFEYVDQNGAIQGEQIINNIYSMLIIGDRDKILSSSLGSHGTISVLNLYLI